MTHDIPTADAVRRVQDAALERALVDDTDAARYVAFAGALEPVRRDAIESDTAGLVGPMLACTTLAARSGSTAVDPAGTPTTTSPTPVDATIATIDDPGRSPAGDAPGPRVEGAVLAFQRFDIDLERAAQFAGCSSADVAALVERRAAGGRR